MEAEDRSCDDNYQNDHISQMPHLTSVAEGVSLDPGPWHAPHSELADQSTPLVLGMPNHTPRFYKSSDLNLPTLIEKSKKASGTLNPRGPNEPITVKDTMASLEENKSDDRVAFTLMEKMKHTLDLGNSPDPDTPSLLGKTGPSPALGRSTSQIGENMQQTLPTHLDFMPPADTFRQAVGDCGSVEGKMTTYVPDHDPSVNKYDMHCSWKNIFW